MTKKVRDSNIELLRIICILGVIVLHYNGNVALDMVVKGSINDYLLLGLEILFICAVNLFVLISGFFLCSTNSRRAIKAIELVVQVMLFGLGKYLLRVLLFSAPLTLGGFVSSAIPNNYYVTIYLALYLLSPYINLMLQKLSDKQFGVLLVLYLVLFSLIPTVLDTVNLTTGYNFNGLYPTGSGGSMYGYSFLNFSLMYLLGAYLRRKAPGKALWDWIGLAVCFGVLFVWQLYCHPVARAYSNPLVIGIAVFAFRLMSRVKLRSAIINGLAKGAFTCFLLHDFFLHHIGIDKVVNGNILVLLGHIVLSACGIFLVCWVAWLVYDKVTAPIFRLLGKRLGKLDHLLSPTTETQE